jgi:MFS family permease
VGFARSAPVALAVTAALGVTLGLVNVNFYTIVQTATPAELRGRVLGFINTLAGALMPLGLAVGGIVGDWTGKNVPLVYTACAVSAFTINAIALGRRDTRAFLTGG